MALAVCGTLTAADDSTVLLPLGLFHVPGAFGSVWQTELAIRNTGAETLEVTHAGSQCSIVCPFPVFELTSGQSLLIKNEENEPLVASTSGLVLHLQGRQVVSPSNIHFNLRIRDLSRTSTTWGTELPVVRATQFTSLPIELLNLPVTPGFRFTVRVYALDGDVPIQGVARIFDLKNGQLISTVPFSLTRAPDQSPTYYPAYAQLDQLADHLAGLTSDTVVIEISPSQAGQQLWAFASITNNETQDVTTVSSQ